MTDTTAKAKNGKKEASGNERASGLFKDIPDNELDWDLHAKNIKAFENHSSHFAGKLKAVTATQSRLVKNAEGEYDIDFRGTRLYGTGAEKWSKDRIENFAERKGVQQILLNPLDSSNMDDEANVTGYRIINRATKSGIKFLTAPRNPHCYHLVVFGLGLGLHLQDLVEKTRCRYVIIVEPNMEFAYHSLFVMDWTSFFEKMDATERLHSFLCFGSSAEIVDNVRGNVRFINPSFIDGTIFFSTYANSMMDDAVDKLLRDRDTIGTGLGFLEDEIDMVRNSYHNLVDYEGRFFKSGERMIHVPVFVIGGGPSLDNDLEFIRKNQDRAIIVSCGTALRILLKNGIMPDFQLEMENVPLVTELITKLSQDHDLSSITLVASTTVDPGVSSLFENTVYYFRSSLASYPLFAPGDDNTLHYATPTVSNLGMAFALAIGCRKYYLFGVDFGARDPKKHHAKDAPYNQGEVEFTTVISEPHVANFGGQVYTELVYKWARSTMEQGLEGAASGRAYYNCSDGCRIEHTVPCLSSTIKLPAVADKHVQMQDILESFPKYTKDMFDDAWTNRNLRQCLGDFANVGIDVVNGITPAQRAVKDQKLAKSSGNRKRKTTTETSALDTSSPAYDLQFTTDMCRFLIPAGNKETTSEHHFFRGSIFMTLALVSYYYNRLAEEDTREMFVQIVKEEMIYQLERTRKRIHLFYDKLEGVVSTDMEEPAPPDEA